MQTLEIFPWIEFMWQSFSSKGGYCGGFCKMTLEAAPVLDKVNSIHIQDGLTAGKSWANQQWYLNMW